MGSAHFADFFSREKYEIVGVIDGCDIIQLEGRACDFSALLDWLYPGGLSQVIDLEPSFFTLACLLRASCLWTSPAAKAWVLKKLKERWPVDVGEISSQFDLLRYATKAIVLLGACGEASLIKQAFYSLLCEVDVESGAQAEIQSQDSDSPPTEMPGVHEGEYYHEPPIWAAHDSALSRRDIVRFIRLQNFAAQRWRTLTLKAPTYGFLSNGGCHERSSCLGVFKKIWHPSVTEAEFSDRGRFDPLLCLQILKDMEWEEQGICSACARDCRERWEYERQRFWDDLDDELGIRGSNSRQRQDYRVVLLGNFEPYSHTITL
ncbi:hypothetical protein BOTBODRAFT_56289 [Botryobasidium botryosum FD-172 SS1]|uniref:BTB domain-containing protein n=1 Tax=Botryobasidium botryosum (strain FD-172 SS1) TaxID=930990 RepID=A0A067MEV4_BOTB1|nr:hypothetical protein BOTBODRAFT_56289 [Botryobasidium botryosum FD-172 SS1]